MLCPRPSTFLRHNLHSEKKGKQPHTEEALSVLEILTHLRVSFCKVTLWTLQTWSAAAPVSPEPFIVLWMSFLSPHLCNPTWWKQRRAVTGSRWMWNLAPSTTRQGIMWTQAQWICISHHWQWFRCKGMWGSHYELVQVCVPPCMHKFFQILQKLRVPPPTRYIKYRYNLLKNSDSPFHMLS